MACSGSAVHPSSAKSEWACGCGASNWASREKCRRCGKTRRGGKKAPPPQQKIIPAKISTALPKTPVWRKGAVTEKPQPKPRPAPAQPAKPPWVCAKEAAARAEQLTVALEAAKAVAGGCGPVVAQLEAELAAARKAAVDDRPLSAQIEGCRAFLAREEKRAAAQAEAVKEALARQDEIAANLAAHRVRLAELESAAKAAAEASAAAPAELVPAGAAAALTEVEQLRAELQQCRAERDELRAARDGAESPAATPQRRRGRSPQRSASADGRPRHRHRAASSPAPAAPPADAVLAAAAGGGPPIPPSTRRGSRSGASTAAAPERVARRGCGYHYRGARCAAQHRIHCAAAAGGGRLCRGPGCRGARIPHLSATLQLTGGEWQLLCYRYPLY